MLNAAIVGLGVWGRQLVDSVLEGGRPKSEHIRFTRAVTRTPAKALDYAKRQGLSLSDNYESILADAEVQAVVLATPPRTHPAEIEAAVAAGKHVFVEKPFTMDKASAERAAASCRAAKLVLAVGHNRRFMPSFRAFEDLVGSGELGRIMHVEANFSGNLALGYPAGIWRTDPAENPAGGMVAMGIHMIDTLIHLLGPIAEVRARSHRRVLETLVDDTTSVLLRFESGVTGTLAVLMATPRIWKEHVMGSKGWAFMRDWETIDVKRIEGAVETRVYPLIDIERAELEAFAAAAAGGNPYPVTLEEAVHGIAVFEAVTKSVEGDGEQVEVE